LGFFYKTFILYKYIKNKKKDLKTIKLLIDDNIYNAKLFSIGKKYLSTDIKLDSGKHILSNIKIYDNKKLICNKNINIEFISDASFPYEIPININYLITKSNIYLKINKLNLFNYIKKLF